MRVSRIKKPNRHNIPIVSCKSGKNDHEQNPATRRDLLIGLGGLYGATSLSDPFAYANPICTPRHNPMWASSPANRKWPLELLPSNIHKDQKLRIPFCVLPNAH